MARGESWLKAELVKALNWDEFVVEGVVDVVSKAKTADEMQEIVNDFMDNNPVAIAIISDYMEAKNAPKEQKHQQSGGSARAQPVVPPRQQSHPSSYSASLAAAAKPPPAQQVAAAKQEKDKWLNLGGAQPPTVEELSADTTKDAKLNAKEQAEATLSMFKRGSSKVKPRGAATGSSSSSSRKGQQQLDSITANLERKVANCLSCGKIFDCRNVTNDIIRFIHDGFCCTFCGSTVAMSQQQRIQQAQQQQQAEVAAGDSNAADSATARAIAFKDRLVDYDRNSQQRTTVIDNQSDYFEIDTNAWLSEEERAELRRREQLEAEAAAARKNKVFVTLDLLGRKVLTAEGPGGADGGGGSSGAAFQVVSATDQLRQSLSNSSSNSGAGDGSKQRAVAASSPAASSSKGADMDGQSAQVLIDQALAAIRDLRITACPNIATPTPVFVPVRSQQQQQQQQQQHSKATDKAGKQQKQQPKQQQPKQQQKQQRQQQGSDSRRGGGAAARAAAADSRIQDDSIFVDFEAELLYDDLVKQQQQQQQGSGVPSVQA